MSRRFTIDPTKPFFIFDTAGEWHATVLGWYIFDLRGDYIGFVRNEGYDVYTTSGEWIGNLYKDGRIIRQRSADRPPLLKHVPPKPPKPKLPAARTAGADPRRSRLQQARRARLGPGSLQAHLRPDPRRGRGVSRARTKAHRRFALHAQRVDGSAGRELARQRSRRRDHEDGRRSRARWSPCATPEIWS